MRQKIERAMRVVAVASGLIPMTDETRFQQVMMHLARCRTAGDIDTAYDELYRATRQLFKSFHATPAAVQACEATCDDLYLQLESVIALGA